MTVAVAEPDRQRCAVSGLREHDEIGLAIAIEIAACDRAGIKTRPRLRGEMAGPVAEQQRAVSAGDIEFAVAV